MYTTHFLICSLLAQLPPAAQSPAAPRAGQHGMQGARERGQNTTAPAAGEAPAAPTTGVIPPAETDAPPPPVSADIPPARKEAPPAAAQPPAAPGKLVPVEPRSARTAPAEILSQALAVPEGEQPRGRPMPLVEVLRSVPDRAGQLRATESYWRLAEALADYNFAWDEYQQFERLKPAQHPDSEPSTDQRMLAPRLQAAKARLKDADVALVAGQYDLAGSIRLPTGQTLPLPSDIPHVGPYRTELDNLYQGRAIPPRAVLIDRTLPIRRSAIESRAAAVNAAGDALMAAEEAHFEGRSDLALVLSLVDELSRQRRAFMADVRTYNLEIAEYAMSAPTPPLDPQGLASMLIKLPAGSVPAGTVAGATTNPAGATGIERAGFNQPIVAPQQMPLQPVPEGQLNLAPPPVNPAAPVRNEPTLAPPRPPQQTPREQRLPPLPRGDEEKTPYGSTSTEKSMPRFGTYAARRPTGIPENQTAPADMLPEAPLAASTEAPVAESGTPVTPNADIPAAEPPAAATTTAALHASPCLYPALRDRSSADQARQLALVLCWEPAAVTAESAPIPLADYLVNVPAERRRDAIASYWQAHFHAARAQLLAQQLEQFEALGGTIASEGLQGPGGAEAMLLVRAAQLAAQADARNAQIERLTAQWSLTQAAGRPLTGSPWLIAETPPHAGGYRLQLNELPRELATAPTIQRLAATIPQLRAALVDRAAAVVAADDARGNMDLDPTFSMAETRQALQAISDQTAETAAFLARLTDYNIEIAAYANAVLPPATGSESLVRALVSTTQTPVGN